MKRIGLIIAVLLLLAGCTQPPPETTPPSTTTEPVPTVPASQQYAEARERVENAKNLVMEYTVSQQRKLGKELFPTEITGKASYSNIHRTHMVAVVEEKLELGQYSGTYAEAYCVGKAYSVVRDCRFQAEMTPTEFVHRQLPAVLIDESLYGSVERVEEKDVTRLIFTEPAALEGWVEGEALIAASGTAVLDSVGNLIRSEYTAEFEKGGAVVTLHISVSIQTPANLDLSAVHIAHEKDSILLENLDAPRQLVQTVAAVYNAQKLDCSIREAIESEAVSLICTQQRELGFSGRGESFQGMADHTMSMTDYRGQVTQTSQKESFVNGLYKMTRQDGAVITDSSVTAAAMRQYLEDTALSGLFAIKYIKNAAVQEADGFLRYEFTANDSFCADLMAQLTAFLQVELDSKAESSQTEAAGGYLVIDPETELPMAFGIYLTRTHTIDSIPYALRYTLEETLKFGIE